MTRPPDGDALVLDKLLAAIVAPARAMAERAVATRDQHARTLDGLRRELAAAHSSAAEWRARAVAAEREVSGYRARVPVKAKARARR